VFGPDKGTDRDRMREFRIRREREEESLPGKDQPGYPFFLFPRLLWRPFAILRWNWWLAREMKRRPYLWVKILDEQERLIGMGLILSPDHRFARIGIHYRLRKRAVMILANRPVEFYVYYEPMMPIRLA
jgi:hypothetical protein